MCVPVLRFRHTELYWLRASAGFPPSDTITLFSTLGIFHYRGCKRDRRIPRWVPTTQLTMKKKWGRDKPAQGKQCHYLKGSWLWYRLPSLLLFNVTSLCKKIKEVSVTVTSVNASIVVITEDWPFVLDMCAIENTYALFHDLRKERRGGGILSWWPQANTYTSGCFWGFSWGLRLHLNHARLFILPSVLPIIHHAHPPLMC